MSSWNVCTKVASVNGAGMKFSAVLACAAAPQSVRLCDACMFVSCQAHLFKSVVAASMLGDHVTHACAVMSNNSIRAASAYREQALAMQPPVLTFWDSQKHNNYSGLPNLLATSESCSHVCCAKGSQKGAPILVAMEK